MSYHQVLEFSTSPSCCCCCEPEFDPALLLLIESRHDALDSPSTPCIRVPSPLAWGRNNVRELRAQRRHVLEDGGRGSILTASPLSHSSTIGVPAANCCSLYKSGTWYRYLASYDTWYAWSPYNTKKSKILFLHGAACKILHSYEEVQKWSHKQKGQKGSILESKKILHNKRPKCKLAT